MPEYIVKAKVDQIVTREVQLKITAGSEEEAETKTREALAEYPQPVTVSGVSRILVGKSTYWIPRSIDLTTKIEKDNENG